MGTDEAGTIRRNSSGTISSGGIGGSGAMGASVRSMVGGACVRSMMGGAAGGSDGLSIVPGDRMIVLDRDRK